MSDEKMAASISIAAPAVGYRTATRYADRAEFLFRGIDLRGARVLDVGCGTGAWALWAALHGASHVVGLEPEAHGSTPHTLRVFQQTIEQLNLAATVHASSTRLEDLPAGQEFDVVVMYNVINHIDEEAVQSLHQNAAAAERYVAVFRQLYSRMAAGGYLLVADCARNNFWNDLSLPSPLARTIEWEKHQNPRTWTSLLQQAGFRAYDLRWSPLQPFTRLTANRVVQYLTTSHFVLRMQK